MWANWTAAFGVLIEFVGFGTLAYDLWQTNRGTIRETVELKAEETDAVRMVVSQADKPGESSGIGVEGGRISKLLDQIAFREGDLRKQTALVLRGIIITAFGCLLQTIGSFAQAIQSCGPN